MSKAFLNGDIYVSEKWQWDRGNLAIFSTLAGCYLGRESLALLGDSVARETHLVYAASAPDLWGQLIRFSRSSSK